MVYFNYRYQRFSVQRKKQMTRIFLLGLIASALIALTLTGRLSWIIAALGAMLPLLPRVARFIFSMWPSINPYFQRFQQNRQSNMRGRFINLQIDMLSGELQGEVLEGDFAGQQLQMMSLEQILLLLAHCKKQDMKSAALLEAYLDRQHAGWAESENSQYKSTKNESKFSDTEMNHQQALDILGLSSAATQKDILKAHKRLMQGLHPDRGGSDYLAKQINCARDLLLKNI